MSSLFAYRMELLNLLQLFCTTLPTWGLAGILAFVALYATLELISVPVLPLTASAGAIWGACARAEPPPRERTHSVDCELGMVDRKSHDKHSALS
jgi:hypothetical protein